MGKPCPLVDDNGTPCDHIMSPEEEAQDGYCDRCACLLSDWWMNGDKPLLFNNEEKNDVC